MIVIAITVKNIMFKYYFYNATVKIIQLYNRIYK